MSKFVAQTPLFVPSFSSKGNLLLPTDNGGYVSDNYELLKTLDWRISQSYLISAYDVYYGLMPENPNEWPETDYLFVDSGGYEINDSYDLSERNKFNYRVNPWDVDKMKEVYRRIVCCPKFQNTEIVLSAFDSYGPLNEQLLRSRMLADEFPNVTINHIIKRNCSRDQLLKELERSDLIKGISIIGFTEKELGDTLGERLKNLIAIKRALLRRSWPGYIHVFGGLEPSLSILYYFAGADIFDGLSWQRVRYNALGGAETLYAPQKYAVNFLEVENKFCMMIDNVSVLNEMYNSLSYRTEQRFDLFDALENKLSEKGVLLQDIMKLLEG